MRINFCACLLLFASSFLVRCSNNSTSDIAEIPSNTKVYKINDSLLKSLFYTDSLSDLTLLQTFYSKNNNSPYWFSLDKMDELNLLSSFFQSVSNHGLNPNFYDYKLLQHILPDKIDSTYILQSWNSDTLLTNDAIVSNAFIKLVKHLNNGVITRPELADTNWFHPSKSLTKEQFELLTDTLHQCGLINLMDDLNINSIVNKKLREELISLKKIYDNQGWPGVEYGESLKPDDVDNRIIGAKQRLFKEGFLTTNDSSLIFNESLTNAVKLFQIKYNLIADGVIGKATIDAMNVTVSSRLKSVVVSMERNRWLPFDFGDEYILANIPGFNLNYYKSDTLFYKSKSIVGRTSRQTPAFNDTMTYVELNPYWTIPPTILEEDVIPHILKDSSYLKNKNIRVLTKAGVEVDPDSIDWPSVNPGRVPYKLKKDPGPYNDLGRVKFMFPNKHLIYFHDTPSRYLFASNVTAFSSGCVRIRDPFDFANALFHKDTIWGNDSIVAEIKKGENKIIKLNHPIPVYLIYQTVWVNEAGEIIYGNDIYEKDEFIYSKLHYNLEALETKSREIIKLDSTLVQ